jgi:hypothetical protein
LTWLPLSADLSSDVTDKLPIGPQTIAMEGRHQEFPLSLVGVTVKQQDRVLTHHSLQNSIALPGGGLGSIEHKNFPYHLRVTYIDQRR